MLSITPTEPSPRPMPGVSTEPHGDALLRALSPLPPPTVDLQLSARPTRRLSWSTPALLCLCLLLCALAIALGNLGAPSPIVAFLGIAGAVVFGLTIVVALFRALQGLVDLVGRPMDGVVEVADTTGCTSRQPRHGGFRHARRVLRHRRVRSWAAATPPRRMLLPDLRSDPGWALSPLALDGAGSPPAWPTSGERTAGPSMPRSQHSQGSPWT